MHPRGAGRTNLSVCEERLLAERTQGPREPADQVQVLAKRTRCLAMDAAVTLARLRHSTCAGKFIVLFLLFTMRAKFYS
jgi:hypothetical protein